MPNGIEEVKICKETLDIADERWCKSTSEIYLKNYTPNRNCQKHTNAKTAESSLRSGVRQPQIAVPAFATSALQNDTRREKMTTIGRH